VRLLVYLPLLISALAAVGARPLAARLEPREATWLLTAATVVLAGCSTAALALLVASAAAQVPVLAAMGHYSQPVLHRGDPTSAVTGAVAAFVLTAAALAVAITFRCRARALAESYRRAARLHDDGAVVVVPGSAIEAYALPGSPGRIVVSGRLFQSLDEAGRAALLAHERAHLACRHHLFTTVAYLAAAANPVLLPLARAVDYTVERWADEHAARVTGNRRLVAATIGQVAMLATPVHRPAATLGIVTAQARRASARSRRISVAWAGPVPRRVAALLAPPPRTRALLLAVAVVVVLVAGVAALQAARDLHALLELADTAH
jgi:beta-lactamase regulating signal transducer with metallopeptidase domain